MLFYVALNYLKQAKGLASAPWANEDIVSMGLNVQLPL